MSTAMIRLLFILFALGPSSSVLAANCGALNQRPCTLLERVPSCDANLVESGGRCISRQAAQRQPIINIPARQRPAQCGRHNQRPCNVAEFIPSCDAGLVEFQGQCRTQAEARARPGHCGRHQQRPCNVAEFVPSCDAGLVEFQGQCRTQAEATARPAHCGRHQQRPCTLAEFVPSCEASLVESQGHCKTHVVAAAPAHCGSLNQRACNVLEHIPSCTAGLAEIRGTCRTIGVCGTAGQRPCEIGERVPSCNPNLKENFKANVCEALRPGESPFLGGLLSLSEFYGDTITAVCQQGMGTIRIDTRTAIGVGAECTKNVFIGAACSYMADLLGAGIASSVGSVADTPRQIADAQRQAKLFEGKVDLAYQSATCLPFAEKLAPATGHGRAKGQQCGNGQFADPNGSCYSCPGGYTRTLEPVDSARACVDKPAGELLRSACAVFQAATQDMAKSASCTTQILSSGVFVDTKLGFDGASREFCLATGELTHAITSIIVPGKTPDQKARQISGSLGNFVQKIKSTKQGLDPALNALSNARTVVDQGSNMGDKLDNLLSCK